MNPIRRKTWILGHLALRRCTARARELSDACSILPRIALQKPVLAAGESARPRGSDGSRSEHLRPRASECACRA